MPPRERQKLQPRSIEAILNTTQNRINRDQNRWEGAGGEGPYPVWNQPNPQERLHSLDDMSAGWLQASAPVDNSGLMLAMANNPNVNQMKDDYFGHRLVDTGWGQGLLNRWARLYGDEKDLEVLPDLGDKSGWLNADWGFDIEREDDGWKYGINAKWDTPKWLGGYSG